VKALAAFIASMLIFSTIGAVVRFIDLPSAEIAFIRGLVGGACLLPFLWLGRRPGLKADLAANWLLLLLTGAVLAGNWIFLFEAYRHTTIALAAVSYYTAPVLVMVLTPFVLKERLSPLKLACLALTVGGMVLVTGLGQSGGGLQANLAGLAFGCLAAACYASLTLLNKFLRRLGGLESTIPQLLLASVFLLPYVLLGGGMKPLAPAGPSLILLLLLGVVHTGLGFLCYFSSIKSLKTQEIAILCYLDPLSSVLISLVAFGEAMSPWQMAGAVLICGSTLAGTLNWQALRGSPAKAPAAD
jgi:drug/metabolite transporter (DMT)-like permease